MFFSLGQAFSNTATKLLVYIYKVHGYEHYELKAYDDEHAVECLLVNRTRAPGAPTLVPNTEKYPKYPTKFTQAELESTLAQLGLKKVTDIDEIKTYDWGPLDYIKQPVDEKISALQARAHRARSFRLQVRLT